MVFNISLFILVQDWVKTGLQIEVLALIHNQTENRLRHARGLAHLHRVGYIHTEILSKNPHLFIKG